ncbi:serine protease [Rhizobium sp. RMa-01]|uniref:serine protease n=1 Tax=unclassified Rhizobium TaxID=2613769 RepID=UPI000916C737|nr:MULTISPECIES: serine protease [unclassified Rhizobium]OHV26736.1 hypothetical protein BBJ66_01650 [Rhizobium sp. RSm-3]RVU12458.1 serine protease [Rhizobium sp. RMa-01]
MRLLFFVGWALLVSSQIALAQAVKPLDERILSDKQFLSKPFEFRNAVASFVLKKSPKIVGGMAAASGQFPWAVSLGVAWIDDRFKAHFCGGSIISDRWILTAAHCVKGLTNSDIIVTSGSTLLDSTARSSEVADIVMYKPYKRPEEGNDIALVRLVLPLIFDSNTNSVRLPDETDDRDGAALTEDNSDFYLAVTGWGSTGKAKTVRQLQYVGVPFVDPEDCHYQTLNVNRMMCAGFKLGKKDSCSGDSGSGLVYSPKGKPPAELGIVSFGRECALPGKPGVYTRVLRYVPWIEKNIKAQP